MDHVYEQNLKKSFKFDHRERFLCKNAQQNSCWPETKKNTQKGCEFRPQREAFFEKHFWRVFEAQSIRETFAIAHNKSKTKPKSPKISFGFETLVSSSSSCNCFHKHISEELLVCLSKSRSKTEWKYRVDARSFSTIARILFSLRNERGNICINKSLRHRTKLRKVKQKNLKQLESIRSLNPLDSTKGKLLKSYEKNLPYKIFSTWMSVEK